jgi:DNA-binding MarR family transcriptional regulator
METFKVSPVPSPEILELADLTMYLQRFFLVSLTEKISKRKLSIPQYTLLGFLSVHESLNMGKLAALMGHTTPATTGLVDRLAEAELVERFATPSDRRQVLVRITGKGRLLVEEMKNELIHNLHGIAANLQQEDRKAWPRIYKAMKESCSARLRSCGRPVD